MLYAARPCPPRKTARLSSIVVGFALLLFGHFGALANTMSPYRVGPGDQLRITTYGEPQLSGLFKIGADGCISYPLVGRVCVAGKTLDEVVALLRADLREFITTSNNLTADIGQYANVYAMGDVEKAGAQEYRPGMIVSELVALAGGFRRGTPEGADVSARLLTVAQEIRDEKLQRFSGLVQRVRLLAETSGSDFDESKAPLDPSLPAEVAKRIVADEVSLYKSRQHALADMRAALIRQTDAFETEIATLNESVVLHENEIKLIQQESDTQAALVDKGVATATKLQALRRELAGALRLSLDIRASLARSRQGQLEVAQKLIEVTTLRANENSTTLRDLDVTLGRQEQSMESKLSIAEELSAQTEQLTGSKRRRYDYSVLRIVESRYVVQGLTAMDELKSGDILRVQAELGGAGPYSGDRASFSAAAR